MKTSPPTILASALRAFFGQHLPLTRGLSPKTLLSYRDAFALLLRFLATRQACPVVDLDIRHLSPETLLAFLEHLETERGNSPPTRNARLAALHSFARFLATRYPEYLELCQRILAIPTKRTSIAPVEYLEGDEIGAMLEAVDLHQPQGQRDQGLEGTDIAWALDIHVNTVYSDLKAFEHDGLACVHQRMRSGAPVRIGPIQRAEILRLGISPK